MININELQRGNLLIKDGEVVKVLGLFNEMGRTRDGGDTVDWIRLDNLLDYKPSQFEPIKLTKELLIDKLGFVKQMFQFCEITFNNFKLYLSPSIFGGYYLSINFTDSQVSVIDGLDPIMYLHQLQNLINSMSGGQYLLDVSKV